MTSRRSAAHRSAESIVADIRRTKKYRYANEDVVRRAVEWAGTRHRSEKEVGKAAKRKLHQIYGAFFGTIDYSGLEAAVDEIPLGTDEALRDACARILRMHASTAERLPLLENFYHRVFEITGTPYSVLDLACGFDPFALPWMTLPTDTTYLPVDMDDRLAVIQNRFLEKLARPALATSADLLGSWDVPEADVVFLLKTLPTLEQQEPGAPERLIRRLRAKHIVVSFPTRTLGGRNVGMAATYARYVQELADILEVSCETLAFPQETVYIMRRS